MKKERLPFADVMLREQAILEVVADEGVEVDATMISELAAAFARLTTGPAVLLVNRINAYSLTFDALLAIAQLEQIKAIAILTYSSVSQRTAETHRVFEFNMEVFTDSTKALAWLAEQRRTLCTTP